MRHKNRIASFLLPVPVDETRRCPKWTIAAKCFMLQSILHALGGVNTTVSLSGKLGVL